jgi:hypothetical protein
VNPDPGEQKWSRKIKKKPGRYLWFLALDVIFSGLKASPVAWTSFMEA